MQSLQFLTAQGTQIAGVAVELKKNPSLQVKQTVSAETPLNLQVAQLGLIVVVQELHCNSSADLIVCF